MKIPATPQHTDKDIRNARDLAHDTAVLDAVFKENTRYLHWDDVSRRKYPVDPLYIWVLMKIFRLKDAHNLSFADWTFSYSLDDSCWRKLHLLDKTAAGNLSSILDAAGQERERYIISSLMEEAIASSQLEGAATNPAGCKTDASGTAETPDPRGTDDCEQLSHHEGSPDPENRGSVSRIDPEVPCHDHCGNS